MVHTSRGALALPLVLLLISARCAAAASDTKVEAASSSAPVLRGTRSPGLGNSSRADSSTVGAPLVAEQQHGSGGNQSGLVSNASGGGIAHQSAKDTDWEHDPECLVSGFWQVNDDLVVRFARISKGVPHKWNATFYPMKGSWYYGGDEPRQCSMHVDEADSVPQLVPRCLFHVPARKVSSLYASPCPVYWGLVSNSMWGAPPSQVTEPAWTQPEFASAWDPTPQLCAVATGVGKLIGQLQWSNSGIWGIGGCENKDFTRLSPELAALDEAGWTEVVSYQWMFGVEVFLRRLAAKSEVSITDEAAFQQFVMVSFDHVMAGHVPTFASTVASVVAASWR